MTKTVEELEDEIVMLKDALGMTYKGNPEWPISPMERRLLGIIAKTGRAHHERIRTALYAHKSDPPGDKIIHVHVSHLRRKLKPYGIEIKTTFGEGYWLTPESRERVMAYERNPPSAAAA